jgi:hypothetical protein
MRILMLGLTLVSLLILPAMAADISGKWAFSVDLDYGAGHGEPTFVLEQKGGKLTGTYNGPVGEHKVIGTVTGETAEFGFEFTRDGQAVKAKYTAKVEDAKKMSGTITFTSSEGSSGGKWTAAKQ